MYAFCVMSLILSTSSGQTSTQTVHPFSAMHFSLSTTTGTVVRVCAKGTPCSPHSGFVLLDQEVFELRFGREFPQ
jgi:hypothetical protein